MPQVKARFEASEEMKTTRKRTPFVELPLGATEDRVTGTIDIERALKEAGKAFEPGILARVNRGILYIDEVGPRLPIYQQIGGKQWFSARVCNGLAS